MVRNITGNYLSYTRQPDPASPDVTGFLSALAKRESGGQKDPYTAIGKKTKSGDVAYGKYQIMGNNIPSWTKQYLGTAMTPEQFMNDPQAQDQLMTKRATDLYKQYGDWSDVASVHFSGQPVAKAGNAADVNGTTVPQYVQDILKFMGGGVAQAGTTSDTPAPPDGGMTLAQIQAGGGKTIQSAGGGMTLDQLKAAGATPSAPGAVPSSQIPGPGNTPSPDQGSTAGNIGKGIVNIAKGVAQSTAGDFKSLDNLVFHPGAENFWDEVGGSVNAVSDVMLAGGLIVGDVATGGADIPADPVEAAGAIGARDAAEKGIGTAVKKVAQGTLGRFAAGKGAGAAAQAVGAGVTSAAKAKGQGESTEGAVGEGLVSAGITLGTLGVMNTLGPKVQNTILNAISKTKFAGFVQQHLQSAADALSSAVESSRMGAAISSVRARLGSAAKQILTANDGLLSNLYSKAMKEPLPTDVGHMADATYNRANISSVAINRKFQGIISRFENFDLPKDVIADIQKNLPKGFTAPSTAEVKKMVMDEEDNIVKSGNTVGMGHADITKKARATVAATLQKTAQDGGDEASVVEKLQSAITSGAKVTAADVLHAIEVTPDTVKQSIATSAAWGAIKDVVGKTAEGKKLLSDFLDASISRYQNQEQRGFAEILKNGQGQGWQTAVDAMLRNVTEGNVENFKTALGPVGIQKFGTMLIKRIVGAGALAYRGAIKTANGKYTTATVDAAQKAFSSSIDGYLSQLEKLPGILTDTQVQALHDLRDSIPNVSEFARNLGIDTSVLGKEISQVKSLGASAQDIATVGASDIGKFLASGSGQMDKVPDLLMKSDTTEIAALKNTLGEDSNEWKALSGSALGKIIQATTGLFGATDKNTVESMLGKIDVSVGGSKEKFNALFGKDGGQIFQDLINFSSASIEKKGTLGSSALKAGAAVVAHAFGHPYISYLLGKDMVKNAMSDEERSLVEELATASPAQLKSQFMSEIKKTGNVFSSATISAIQAFNRAIAPVLKYEVAKKAGISAASGVQGVISAPTGASDTSGE